MKNAFLKLYFRNLFRKEIDLNLINENEVFKYLSRLEEVESTIRDEWGNWEFPYSEAFFKGIMLKPWLDYEVRKCTKTSRPVEWPNGKNFTICLSHDVDEVSFSESKRILRFLFRRLFLERDVSSQDKMRGVLAFVNLLYRNIMRKNEVEIYDYSRWLELEGRYGYKSTFFVFPSDVSLYSKYDCLYKYNDMTIFDGKQMTVANMIREIDQAGWEIGLHGSIFSARDKLLLEGEKQGLESILGHRVISIRNHYLTYDVNITPMVQSEAGFLVDSTQGFNRFVGFRAGTAFPYPCFDHKNAEVLPIWEISQQIMDGALFTNNALEYNEEKAIKLSKQMMDEVEAVNGVLCISWHPNNINNEKYLNVYRAILEEGYRRNAWGCSIGELYRFWTNKG